MFCPSVSSNDVYYAECCVVYKHSKNCRARIFSLDLIRKYMSNSLYTRGIQRIFSLFFSVVFKTNMCHLEIYEFLLKNILVYINI